VRHSEWLDLAITVKMHDFQHLEWAQVHLKPFGSVF